jgi:hypothetical protein
MPYQFQQSTEVDKTCREIALAVVAISTSFFRSAIDPVLESGASLSSILMSRASIFYAPTATDLPSLNHFPMDGI